MNLLWFVVILVLVSCSKQTTSRRFYQTSQEIELTNQVVINQTACGQNETSIFVHTAAVTSGKYFDRRMTIRKTWGKEAKAHNMRVIFVIGVPSNVTLQKQIITESNKYGDILQFKFTDAYYNLTLKAIAELRWASRHCTASRYMMRVDDDVLVNVPLLHQWIEEDKIHTGLSGMEQTVHSHRQVNYKWYMPTEFYPNATYTFLTGFGYILTIDQLKPLVETIDKYPDQILDIDDVFITGMIVDYGHLKRNNFSAEFRYYCGLDACILDGTILVHPCADSRHTQQMYSLWKSSDTTTCHSSDNLVESAASNPVPLPLIQAETNSQTNSSSWGFMNQVYLILVAAFFIGVAFKLYQQKMQTSISSSSPSSSSLNVEP